MRFLINISLGVIFALGILEGLFRSLPVDSGLRMASTSATDAYSRYLPQQPFVYSHGWSMMNARHGVTNNLGFINAANFDRSATDVLIIGDSFIASLMLNYPDTVQGHLESTMGIRIGTVATPGNRLPDSLQLLRKFVPMLRPAAVVIFVKDWDPAVIAAEPVPGYNGFVSEGDNVALFHHRYQESALKQWMAKSALIRYVHYNLKFAEWLSQALQFGRPISNSVDPVTPTDEAQKKLKFMRYYLAELNAIKQVYGLKITLLVDADRTALYPSLHKKPPNLTMEERGIFIRLANETGFELVDMQPIFMRHWAAHREVFDYLPADRHWNAVAHKLAADALLPGLISGFRSDFFARQKLEN